MKKTLLTVLLLGILTFAVAQTISYDIWFTWTPNPPSELVSGYRIEYQKLPAVTNWTSITFVPSSTNITLIKNLQPGYIYKFRAFAVNGVGIGTNLSNIIQVPTNTPSVVNNFNKLNP